MSYASLLPPLIVALIAGCASPMLPSPDADELVLAATAEVRETDLLVHLVVMNPRPTDVELQWGMCPDEPVLVRVLSAGADVVIWDASDAYHEARCLAALQSLTLKAGESHTFTFRLPVAEIRARTGVPGTFRVTATANFTGRLRSAELDAGTVVIG